MDIKLIKNEEDYHKTLERMGEIFDAPIGTMESDEADILALLIDEYEKKNYRCPKCKSKKVRQQIASFQTITSKKS